MDVKQDLIRKINIQRSAHSYFEHRRKLISILFKAINIVIPAFITFVAFSDLTFLNKFVSKLTKDHITLIIGLGAFAMFLCSVFDEIFDISTKYKEHRNAIEQYSQLLRDMKIVSINEKDSTNTRIELFNQRYIQISSNTIAFTAKEFSKAEKNIYRNHAIRQAIKKEPFLRFWEIKSKAKEIAKELYENDKKAA